MAAIVKANSSLTSGGLAVLKREFSITDDGAVEYRADYVCLTQFANIHIRKFRKGANPATSILPELLQLSLTRTPSLYDLSVESENGLTYFRARYVAESADAGRESEITVSRSEDQRTAAGFITVSTTSPSPIGGYLRSTSRFWVSVDYIAITVTTTSRNAGAGGSRGSVGKIFNRRGWPSSGTISGLSRTTIDSRSSTRSSRGDTTYTFTSTGILTIGG